MTTLALDPRSDRFEFLKWVSDRNAHIPMSELEFLLDIGGPLDEENGDWTDDNWG